MWYDDEFYNEPSEFEIQMDGFKESLARAIKSEFLEEMERLKEENRNLQGIKEHFEQIKMDYEQKKLECYRMMREAESNAKRMKADELMEQFKTFLWRLDWEYLYGPKCDKCDENRMIDVILPSGNVVKDDCQCRKSETKVMIPERMVRYELSDRYSGIAAKNIVQPGTSFDALEKKEDQRMLLFTTKEECLAYCGYLNEKNDVASDVAYRLDGELYKGEE